MGHMTAVFIYQKRAITQYCNDGDLAGIYRNLTLDKSWVTERSYRETLAVYGLDNRIRSATDT